MDTLLLFGRSIAPFAIDCAVKVSVAAIAALLAVHFLGRRQASRSFACIVAAFGMAAILVIGRGHMRMDGESLTPPPASELHAVQAPNESDPAEGPFPTALPGVVAKYGSLFQIRIAARPQAPTVRANRTGTPWIPAVGLIWLAGFLGVLAYHLLGILALSLRLASTRPCTDQRLLHAAERVRETLEAPRAELLLSLRKGTAFVAGLFHPRLVLPAEAVNWPQERLTATLLHEYMHVKRFDVPLAEGIRLLATLAWFSPFPWFALSSALRLREEACDEAVLRAGIPRTSYAADLLDTAWSLTQSGPAAPAASMSSHSHLEQRIRAVLEGPVLRSYVDRLVRSAAAAALIVAAVCAIKIARPLYSIPEFSSSEALPQGTGEWAAAADSRQDGLPSQGAFSILRDGLYARIRVRYQGRTSEIRVPASVLPHMIPLTPRARLMVPFGEFLNAQARQPFFSSGWIIWDDRQAPVCAAASGRVAAVRMDPDFGPTIEVDHGEGLMTRYGLGRHGASTVAPGEFVLAGWPLGTFQSCAPYDLPSLNFSIAIKLGSDLVALDPAPFLLAEPGNHQTPLAAGAVNAAVRLDDREELARLIACGVSVNQASADGTLPLEWALMNRNIPITKDLLAAGADPRLPTWNVHQAHIALHGPTVAELARDSADPSLIALLAPQ